MLRNSRWVWLLAGTALVTAAATVPAAEATTPARTHHHPGGHTHVVAGHLNNPRLLSFGPGGTLYVAEAGSGGTKGPVTGGDGSPEYFGRTGSIARVRHGHVRRVVRHLPSLAQQGGVEPVGPADVRVGKRGHYVVTMGAGIDLAARKSLGHGAGGLGRQIVGRIGHGRHRAADLVRYEWNHNPDHSVDQKGNVTRDSDPAGSLRIGHGNLVADAGGNTLVRTRRGHARKAWAVFPAKLVPFGAGMVPMQAVPTAVVKGPRHSYFVSELTGFPFPKGGAVIYKVRRGHAPKVWATGLTNVTDLAWHRHKLYAVQLADNGLLAAGSAPPQGSLVRVRKGANASPEVIAHLNAPYGVAIHGHHAFVTTCSVCAGEGTVTRVSLPH